MKYNNKPVYRDGKKVADSGREYNRLCELRIMQKAKVIWNLDTQVKYELVPKQRTKSGKYVPPVTYIADFTYYDKNGFHVEDSKGFRTKEYNIKKKLMLYIHGIEIEET